MSNENLNSSGNWKSKLDELEGLPGKTLPDKHLLWEKLHERLGGKKGNKKVVWYWIAAACLLFALIISFLNSDKENHQIIKDEVVQKQQEKLIIPPAPVIKKDESKSISPVFFKKNETVTFNQNEIKPAHIEISSRINNAIHVPNTISEHDVVAQTTITEPPPTDNILNITDKLPGKKKLKVVHINELGDPVEKSTDMAHGKESHSFQFKFANQVVYINSAPASNKDGFTILKTKSSPN